MVLENKSLVLDLLEWLAPGPKPYREVMQAWHTHCPRLTIWEDAVDLGLVTRAHSAAAGSVVELSVAGRAFLETEGRA